MTLSSIPRGVLKAGLRIILPVLIVLSTAQVIRMSYFGPITVTAYFVTATAIYPGDEVKISGIKVGTISVIEPEGARTKMILRVDHGVSIPADAKAVIVAPNLVAARYVQLTPVYRSSGPTMHSGALIPLERTAVPVEWDDVKIQLMRLATDLGPSSNVSTTSVARFIDSAADALGDNGDKLRQMLAQLSGLGRILADGSGNIVDVIKNLQIFVSVLHGSGEQMMLFNNKLATLTSVLDDNKSDLDAALTNLSQAVVEVKRFIAGSRDQTSEQVARLADLTQILVNNQMALKNILHVAPNALANAYNDYEPDMGAIRGAFTISNMANPVNAVCAQMGALENVTAVESGKLCALYAGPALKVFNPFLFNFNYLPIPLNPFLAPSADKQNLIYSEPRLAPGGEGPKPGPPELPPAVSAYTGVPGDVPPALPPPPPPGRIPGAAMPDPPAPTTVAQPEPPAPGAIPGLLPAEGGQP